MSKSSTDGYLSPPVDSLTNESAPNAWPGHIDRIAVGLIYALLLLVILPPAVILSVARFYLFGPGHPDWDLKTQVMTNVMYWFILFLFLFKLPGRDRGEDKIAKTMRRKGMGVEQMVVPPCPETSRIGWAKHDRVKPVPRPGFMIWPERETTTAAAGAASNTTRGKGLEKAKRGEKVIIYFVGGGFISGHPLLSHLAWTVSETLDTRVFCVNYRKSIYPDAAFPGNLLDALSGYLYLVNELGFDPHHVVAMGDSAGGNTALALARYLGELKRDGSGVGQVGGLILFSPWCDMTDQPGTSAEFNKKYDYVSSMGVNAIAAHTRHYPKHLRSPYFSPALPSPDGSPRFAHLTGKQGNDEKKNGKGTKVYVQAGTAELLWDQAKMLCRGMKEEGVDVTLREVPGDIHVGILFNLAKPLKATKEDLPEFWNGLD